MDLPFWTVVPFVLLLLAIALMPIAAEKFWHRNRNKALVAALFAAPVAAYLLYLGPATGRRLMCAMEEYASFIILLASLYVVSGGVVLRGDIQAKPWTNTAFLAVGAVLANFIGTTGASMLLIRPLLQTNQERQQTRHLPIFFIFIVSNLGGLLTPLGDPPLFLGFLHGVDFFWTLSLWRPWLLANSFLLGLFLVWDTLAYRRESPQAIARDVRQIEPLHIKGLINLVFLAGIVAAVLFQSDQIAGDNCTLTHPWGELVMLAMAGLSLWLTPREVHKANNFSWGPFLEVAVLFAGIFVTMTPALAWLRQHGQEFGVTEPWQYFWLTGSLSSFLDNAPTYLALATLAAGRESIGALTVNQPLILQAISCGAVFMGAMTYIGNGPNFMVKAIAQEAGLRPPGFLGYLGYSCAILLPLFVAITFLFFT